MVWNFLQNNPEALASAQSFWNEQTGQSVGISSGSLVRTSQPIGLANSSSDSFAGSIQDAITSFFNSIFGVDLKGISSTVWLGVGAYGLYRYMKGKRNWLTYLALGIGAWQSGILNMLFPGGAKSGATGVALATISPTLGLASIFGIGVPLIASLFKRKKKFYRRRSYRRNYSRTTYIMPRTSYRRSY